MTTEIAKCGWCRKEPSVLIERFVTRVEHKCDLQCCCWESHIAWNDLQARILEARRKDFEAGVSTTLGTKLLWQDRDTWFDEYLKGGK